MNVVKEHWTKQFITNTYSCIEHRGIHKCLKDLKRDLRKTRGSSIVHEAEHIKNHIWQYIGYTPQRDNDEVDAYLLTYIYDKITQVFYKHKDNKESIVEKSLIYIRQRKFVKGIEE